jgi:ABC-2 type transport system permease protein
MSSAAPYVIVAAAAVFVAVRLRQRLRGRGAPTTRPAPRSRLAAWQPTGEVALVAAREVRERTRGRVFRVGTIVILLAVAAAVIIPVLRRSSSTSADVGVVGSLSAPLRTTVTAIGPRFGTTVQLVAEPSVSAAEHDLDHGRVDVVIVDANRLIVKTAFGSDDSSTDALFVRALSSAIGLQAALEAAGLSAQRALQLTAQPPPLPVTSLQPAHKSKTRDTATTVYGLILIFILLSQYGTWILMGVAEEKSSRVVEVLLATVRARSLLAGKVIGIGIVAFIQAALIVAVALGLGAAVGSDLLHGGAPLDVVALLGWLVLGYAFYCWVYAAAGSLATRQEHIQTLAFPLQLPIIVGYIVSLTAVSSGHASGFVHVLAYLPPTSPFAMPVLVALGDVAWWQFAVAVVISVVATVAIAQLAATVYLRAILRTGQRVKVRDVIGRAAQPDPGN